MSQLKILGFVLLLGSANSLVSMCEVNRVNNVSSRSDAIVPMIEATIMTTLATLPQAMMYVPFKEAVTFTVHSGVMTGCGIAMVYALPSILFSYLLDDKQSNHSAYQPVVVNQFEFVKQGVIVKPSVIEWRKPLSVSLALLTTFFMLFLNYKELTNNYGI